MPVLNNSSSAVFPKVYVGVPTYNRPHLLKNALENLKRQTYQNLHIVVSDNASTDFEAWSSLIENYKKDERFSFIRQEQNLGFIGNSRFLLSQADGEYFMWVADDDKIEPTFIEKAVSLLEQDHDSVMAFSGWEVEDFMATPPIKTEFTRYVRSLPSADKFTRLYNYLLQPEYYGKARILWGVIRLNALKKCYSAAWNNIQHQPDLTMAELPIEFYLLAEGNLAVIPECLITFSLLPTSAGLKEGALFKNRELEMCTRSFLAYRKALTTFGLPAKEEAVLLQVIKHRELKSKLQIIPYFFVQKYLPSLARAMKWLWFKLMVK